MELIEIGADAFQDIVDWTPVGQVTRGVCAQQPIIVGSNQLVSDASGNLLQLINPISTPNSGLVVNYLVDQNGSHIPMYDTIPFLTSNDNYITLLTAEPEVTSDPEVPSHVLDHMYARKRKEPGSESTRRKRKRVRKKESVIQVANELIMSNVAQTTTTKVNIIRKGCAPTVSNSSPTTSFRPTPRPKILQNTKGNVATPMTKTTASSPTKSPTVIPSVEKTSMSTNSTATSVFMISTNRSDGSEEILKEDCLRQVNSTTDGELCFMLTSSSSTSDPSKTDNNETVMTSDTGQEPQETDSLLNEFSICSFSPDDSQMAGSSSTFLLDDKQVYLSYD